MRLAFLLALLAVGAGSPAARAAQPGRVGDTGAALYEAPSLDSRKLNRLPRGTEVAASNVPRVGFYRVRTPSGAIGWVEERDLILLNPKAPPQASAPAPAPAPSFPPQAPLAAPSPVPPPPAQAQAPARVPPPAIPAPPPAPQSQAQHPQQPSGPRYGKFQLRAQGGAAVLGSSDVTTQFGINAIGTGLEFGGALSLRLSEPLWVTLELGIIQAAVRVEEATTVASYGVKISGVPIFAGVEYELTGEGPFDLRVGLAGGLGLAVRLQSTASHKSPPDNVTVLEGLAFGGQAKAQVGYRLSNTLEVFVGAGFRLLTTPKLVPTLEGQGSELFQDGNGNLVPIAISLSGPFFGGGLLVTF